MKLPPARHRWNLTPRAAIRLQTALAGEIIKRPIRVVPRLIAGSDASFVLNGEKIIAGWVVWDCARRTIVEQVVVVRRVTFPYVPGLLSFREAPALLAAARRLKSEPDVFMIDGQGLSHPRRFGIASHVGLLLDRPTIGCAKSRLCGTFCEPGPMPGNSAELIDRNDCIGRVVRTRQGVKPLFVSVGNKITLADAIRLTLACCEGYRLPEPTRLAHQLVTRAKSSH